MLSCRYGYAWQHFEIRAFDVSTFPPVKILAARPEDSGTYVCTARSSGGSTEARVEVSVEGQPRTSVDEPQMVVVEGRTATLRCHVNGKITPSRATLAPTLLRQRQWFHDSKLFFQFQVHCQTLWGHSCQICSH